MLQVESNEVLESVIIAVGDIKIAQLQKQIRPRTLREVKATSRPLLRPASRAEVWESSIEGPPRVAQRPPDQAATSGRSQARAVQLMLHKPNPVLPNISNSEESVEPEDADASKRPSSCSEGRSKLTTPTRNLEVRGAYHQRLVAVKRAEAASIDLDLPRPQFSVGQSRKKFQKRGTLQSHYVDSGETNPLKGILKRRIMVMTGESSVGESLGSRTTKKVNFDTHKMVLRYLKEKAPPVEVRKATTAGRAD